MKDQEYYEEIAEEEGLLTALKMALLDRGDEMTDEPGNDRAPESVTCHSCATELDSADVSQCPHCGYDASGHAMWRWIHTLMGVVFAFTIVGLPLVYFSYKKSMHHAKKANQGVVEKNLPE
jgi:hypothetical protein